MLTVIELFAGIGTQALALEYEQIPHKVIGISEIDAKAITAYKALHGEVENYGDITKIEALPYADFWTYSSPCTSFSLAGRQAGGDEGSGTASSLIWEVKRLLLKAQAENKLPKYLMLENVKNMLGKKHKHNFDAWVEFLEELGYNNYYEILNAADYGSVQQRERIIMISIRKDVDKGKFNMKFDKVETPSYKTLLEENPTDDIYLTANDLDKMKDFGAPYSFGGYILKGEVYPTITASYGKITGNSAKIIRDPNNIMITNKGVTTPVPSILTPREALRFMGLKQKDCDTLYNTFNNKKALYKLAGNAIVVDVLRMVYKRLFTE